MDIYSQLFTSLREDLAVSHSMKECINAPIMLDFDYVARVSLHESVFKKLQPKQASKMLASAAYSSFIEANNRCAGWATTRSDVDYDFIDRLRVQAEKDLDCLKDWSWYDYLDNAGLITGPGSSLFSQGQNSFFEKLFINRLVTTDINLHTELMRYYARTNRSLLAAERQRQTLTGEVATVVNYSRLGVVRKNAKTDRTICTEPNLNMIFQRALGEGINHALRVHYGYDEALQPDRNREHARTGSLYGDLCTIDLSSASDTISLALCKAILPSWIFAAITDCRSPNTLLDDELIPLAMVSSMGNGFTFPLETYIFSVITRVTAAEHGLAFRRFDHDRVDAGNYGVFGDDIICPSVLFDSLNLRLEMCGFIPNREKSYAHGYFRESCGTDWYGGYDVRGVYLKRIDRVQDRYSAFNRLVRWGLRNQFTLYNTLSVLLSDGWRQCVIPASDPDVEGYKVPASYAPRTRFGYKYRRFRAVKPFVRILKSQVLLYSSYRITSGLRTERKLSNAGPKDFIPSHNNFTGFLLSVIPQVQSIPKLFDHLFPEEASDGSRLDRRDDEQDNCRWERSFCVVWDAVDDVRTSGILAHDWAHVFEALLIYKESLS